MRRRDLLGALAAAALPTLLRSDQPADFTLQIGPVTVELAPGTTVKTLGYNGSAPGPLLRVPEGKSISIDVQNNTGAEEVAHWHGLHIPSDVDGSLEEGTPAVPAPRAAPLQLHGHAQRNALVSQPRFGRAQPEARHLYGTVRLFRY